MPDTDRINAIDLPAETANTLDGTECVVGFDTAEGKKITINNLATFINAAVKTLRKEVTCNAPVEDTSISGYNWKQEVAWSGVTANHAIGNVYVSSGTYNATYRVDTAADKIILYFSTKPATSVKIMVTVTPTTTS